MRNLLLTTTFLFVGLGLASACANDKTTEANNASESHQTSVNDESAKTEGDIRSVVATAAMYVSDLDRSVEFYSRYLGYKLEGESEITDAGSKLALGVDEDMTARFAFLKPVNELTNKPIKGSTLGLIEIDNTDNRYQKINKENDGNRAIIGDLILSNRVENIELINERLMKDGVSFIRPLSQPEGEGSYKVLVVRDPDGRRVEMYQIAKSTEETE